MGGIVQHQFRLRLHVLAAGFAHGKIVLCPVPGPGAHRRRVLLCGGVACAADDLRLGLQLALPATARLGQPPYDPGKRQAGHDQPPEDESPREHAGDVAGDDLADPITDEVAAHDQPIHPAAFAGREEIAGQGGHHRRRGRRHHAQAHPDGQQPHERCRGTGEQDGHRLQRHAERQQPHPVGAVSQDPIGIVNTAPTRDITDSRMPIWVLPI